MFLSFPAFRECAVPTRRFCSPMLFPNRRDGPVSVAPSSLTGPSGLKAGTYSPLLFSHSGQKTGPTHQCCSHIRDKRVGPTRQCWWEGLPAKRQRQTRWKGPAEKPACWLQGPLTRVTGPGPGLCRAKALARTLLGLDAFLENKIKLIHPG